MRILLFCFLFFFITSGALAQHPCSQPTLVLPDTVAGFTIDPVLLKNKDCRDNMIYHVVSYDVFLSRGSTLVTTFSVPNGGAAILPFASFMQPGDRIVLQLTAAMREVNGDRRAIPLGPWAKKTMVVK